MEGSTGIGTRVKTDSGSYTFHGTGLMQFLRLLSSYSAVATKNV